MNEAEERERFEKFVSTHDDFTHWQLWCAALSAPAVPEGYKLVPIEPTPEMVDAAVQAICYGPESGFTRIAGPYRAWRVMLAAAPSPQEQTP